MLTEEDKKAYNNQIQTTATNYCYCRGLGSQDVDDLYIGCDSNKECANGGWYHWKCVPEFKGWNNSAIDAI